MNTEFITIPALTDEIVDGLKGAPIVIDIETTGLNQHTDKILAVGLCSSEERAYYLLPEGLDTLKKLSGEPLVFHNASFDLKLLKRNGIDFMSAPWRDTMLIDHLLDENEKHGLGEIIQRRWADNYKDEFWGKYDKFEDAPDADRISYALRDVVYSWRLYNCQMAELREQGIPATLVDHVHKLAWSLIQTEYWGVSVDLDYLQEIGLKLKSRIEELKPLMREACSLEVEDIEADIWLAELDKRKTPKGKAGVPRPTFNWDSSKQLLELFYGKLGLPPQRNEKTKQPTVDWDALERLKGQHPVVDLLQEYREKAKIYGSFIEGTLDRAHCGRIYPSFNVNGTTTGRISHRDPNLGQLPREGGIRGIYRPGAGNVFIGADYSQLEVCLAAHFSRDASLLRIVLEGASQHDITAEALQIPRQTAKTVNFALGYGASHFKIARVLGVSNEEGKLAFDRYWETYSGVKAQMDLCAKAVDEGKPIVTMYGRRRRFPVQKRMPWDSAYRQAYNSLIQGSGADITSEALWRVDEEFRKRGWGHALFSVHDELLAEVREDVGAEAQALMVEIMEKIPQERGLTVPLKAAPSGPTRRWED